MLSFADSNIEPEPTLSIYKNNPLKVKTSLPFTLTKEQYTLFLLLLLASPRFSFCAKEPSSSDKNTKTKSLIATPDTKLVSSSSNASSTLRSFSTTLSSDSVEIDQIKIHLICQDKKESYPVALRFLSQIDGILSYQLDFTAPKAPLAPSSPNCSLSLQLKGFAYPTYANAEETFSFSSQDEILPFFSGHIFSVPDQREVTPSVPLFAKDFPTQKAAKKKLLPSSRDISKITEIKTSSNSSTKHTR